jgi:YidC/Oxa1 family membrane protein insertase
VSKEISTEARVLLAFVLSMAVMALWTVFFVPKTPPSAPRQQPPAATQAETQQKPAAAAAPATVTAAPAQPSAPKAAGEEKIIVIENDLYRLELSNRGGVVRRWQLKKYVDDAKPARMLDVVHPDAAAARGTWPLAITLPDSTDAQIEQQINGALYQVNEPENLARGPGDVVFEWSDGRIEVTKRLKLTHSYVLELETSVKLEGKPTAHAIAWRGGFGDETVYNFSEHVNVFYRAGGKVKTLPFKKLGVPDRQDRAFRQEGTMDCAGIQDSYFAAAFLPPSGGLALWHWKLEHEAERDGTKRKEPVSEMAVGSTVPGPLALRLFVGPKDREVLSRLDPPLTDLIDFGWFGPFAEPLFLFLKWIHQYIPNYGWAIAAMTFAINMILFPLKVKSFHSMQKMQKVAPEVKAIQEKYKKYSMRDPRKQEMNKEVMAVYSREGINPMGGCWPMLLQMPIWIALYQMLLVTIELRHAPWMWIRDLSSQDPYYILPILMAATMYWMQKMTPMTTTDPAQQRMMQLMPVMMGGMFIIFPVSSGLVLYILTSNVVGMAQQWYLNKTLPAPVKARARDGKK